MRAAKVDDNHKSLGWAGTDGWEQWIGIRADEPRRVAKIKARGRSTESAKETMVLPLAEAGVTIEDVGRFWDQSPFDLQLPNIDGRTMHGNCDLCFLKGANQVLSLILENPTRAQWWIDAESETLASKASGGRFRNDRPDYRTMRDMATETADMFQSDFPLSCYCGD